MAQWVAQRDMNSSAGFGNELLTQKHVICTGARGRGGHTPFLSASQHDIILSALSPGQSV